MTRRSLRLRLLLASTASIFVALAVAGFGLIYLFERHVERRVDAELMTYIGQLAGNLTFKTDGAPSVSIKLADPRFAQPLSGLYWQIQEDKSGARLRSRSLWDYVIPLPPDILRPGVVHHHILSGPAASRLVVRERPVIFDTPSGPRTLRIVAAIDRRTLDRARNEFAEDLFPALLALAVALSLAAWVQVSVGLRPLERIRRGISAIRSQTRRRLSGRYPDEVMPLVAEVNDLLQAQESAMERARNRAADLAHGLKTPLTVLLSDARKLRNSGQKDIADELESLARAMRRHVDRELARTRVAAGPAFGRAETDLVDVVTGVVETLKRAPSGAAVTWRLELPDRCPVPVDADDLNDIVGNLLENAGKWANTEIRVAVTDTPDGVALEVADDGPGVPVDMIESLGARGVRLDEQTPGTGIGLAIVKDLLDVYGGSLHLENAAQGGLAAKVLFPRQKA